MKTWNKVKDIFSKALELDKSKRVSYIKKACKDDTKLFEEVLSLIDAHDMPGVLDRPIDNIRLSAISVAKADRMKGRHIGNYEIIKELGHGGMGSVYLAERADGEFDQLAALKLLHNPFATENQVSRFKRERQILASLQHDNIARLKDGGVTDEGQLYYVMEYVKGTPIDAFCDDHQLTVNKRLNLFLDVCRAVQYAHSKLVVHRDLKPSNILVTKDGRVKLLDFGIAKVMNSDEVHTSEFENLTHKSFLPVTPSYASPEQIRKKEITTASDTYQLGLVLYELLTGCRAYVVDNATPAELEQTICEVPASRPSSKLSKQEKIFDEYNYQKSIHQISVARNTQPAQLQRILKGDLDTIVLKALRKDPDQRYTSAGHLIDDLQRYLNNRPVLARPTTVPYQVGKWFSRHKVVAIASLLVFLSLVIGASVAIWQANHARQAAEQAQAALEETEQALNRAETLHTFLLDLFRAAEPDRPRDQLPSTEELLAIGADRALDEGSAPPSERLGMLLAIGEVYASLGRENDARYLLDEAIVLGIQNVENQPGDLARAYSLKAMIAMREFKISEADEWLKKSGSVIEGSESGRSEFVKIQEQRAQLELMRGNYLSALEFIEPVYEEIRQDRLNDLELQYRIGSRLAGIYRSLGKLDLSQQIRNEISAFIPEIEPEDGITRAIHHNGLAAIQFSRGNFETAESNVLKSIELYEQIFNYPTELWALTKFRLGMIYFYSGQYEKGFKLINEASTDWANAQGRNLDDHEFAKFLNGELLYIFQAWDEAEEKLNRAKVLFNRIDGGDNAWNIVIDGMLGGIACHQGKMDGGLSKINRIKSDEAISQVAPPLQKSIIYEAIAVCQYKSGNKADALKQINRALEIFDFPGYAIVHANRKILKAQILHSLDRIDEGIKTLESTERLFMDLGINNHPYLQSVDKVRNELKLAFVDDE